MDRAPIRKRPKLSEITDMSNKEKKSSVCHKDLVCTVCGAPATGFNFAVITCMCCKAFFRRNALCGLQSLQCRYMSQTCAMNMKTRRDCSYCRLKKCFEVGMKKELILTDDLKRIKREKILANREMTLNLIRPIHSLTIKANGQLRDSHSNFINNINNAYQETCYLPLISFEKNEYEALSHRPIKSRIKIQHYYEYYNKHETSLMNFFQRLPELKQFSNDQQLTLCKHNMRFLIRISLIETISNDLPLWPAINLLIETIFGKQLIEETNNLLRNLKARTNDSICIRLLLVVLFFSTYHTYNGDVDTIRIYKIQEKYTELLWLYLTQRYGQSIACDKFSLIVRRCLHLQTIGHLAELKRQEIQRLNLVLSLE